MTIKSIPVKNPALKLTKYSLLETVVDVPNKFSGNKTGVIPAGTRVLVNKGGSKLEMTFFWINSNAEFAQAMISADATKNIFKQATPEYEPVFKDWTIKNVEVFKSREGGGFNFDIMFNGRKFVEVQEAGDGGPIGIFPVDAEGSKRWDEAKAILVEQYLSNTKRTDQNRIRINVNEFDSDMAIYFLSGFDKGCFSMKQYLAYHEEMELMMGNVIGNDSPPY